MAEALRGGELPDGLRADNPTLTVAAEEGMTLGTAAGWPRVRAVLNWANGSTLSGLLLARVTHAAVTRRPDGLWEATGYRGPNHNRPFTVGNVLFTRHGPGFLASHPQLLAHETRHSDQWAVLGPFFVPLYYAEAFLSWVLTGDFATGNVFEVHAGLGKARYRRPPLESRWRRRTPG